MRYYSTQRPVGPGTYPKPQGNAVKEVFNFDSKTYCEEIGRGVWGYIEYESPLPPELASTYELAPGKAVLKYIAYRCPDGSILLDVNETLWKYGYPFYPKYKCVEIERGFCEAGKSIVTLYTALKKKYSEEAQA